MSRLGACVDSTLTWIGNNKLSSFLIVCLFAFIVSTWTLAAINADLRRRIAEHDNEKPTPEPDTTLPETTIPDTTPTPTTPEITTTTEVVTTTEASTNSNNENKNKSHRRRRHA